MSDADIEADRWLRRFAPNDDADVQLICLPHAGGSASFYRTLALSQAENGDIVVVQYPGRQDRLHEPLIERLSDYVDRLTEVISTRAPKPTLFFGHSMGALLAFEIIRRLEREWPQPLSLMASARRAPSVTSHEEAHLYDDDRLITHVNLLNGADSPALADEEMRRATLPAIRADYRAIATYRPEPMRTVGCPVTVFLGRSDPACSAHEARQWDKHTTSDFRIRFFPGGHFYLSDRWAEINQEIAAELIELRSR